MYKRDSWIIHPIDGKRVYGRMKELETKNSIRKKTAVMAVIAALVMVAVPMMAFDVAADGATTETYYFYVDLTADETQNGEWIVGTGINAVAAFIDAANDAYGAANNVISSSGWITTLDGYSGVGTYGSAGYISWAQYGYVTSAWDSNAYLGSTTVSTNDQYAIFATEYIVTAAGTYVDGTGIADEAAVLLAATYNGAITVPSGYTAVAMSATDSNADHTWDVIWYIMPTAHVASADDYVNSGWGYAQRDDAIGLATLVNTNTLIAADATMDFSTRQVSFTFKSAVTTLSGYAVDLTFDTNQLTYVSAVAASDMPFTVLNTASATSGMISMNAALVSGTIDGNNGLFTITFVVKSGMTSDDSIMVGATLTSISGTGLDLSGPFPTSFASAKILAGTAYPDIVTTGDEVILTGTSDNGGMLNVTFDPAVLRFVNATNVKLIVVNDGIIRIYTASPGTDVVLTFAVVDNPVLTTSQIYVGNDIINVQVSTSSYVIVPAVVNGLTDVSLYKMPAIAGFEMKFTYTGNDPTVSDLARLGNMGSFSTNVDSTNHILTVVWASSVNVDLNNGSLFSVSGCDTLTLIASNAELRHIVDDLSSIRLSVGIADSLKDAENQDPHFIDTTMLGDVNDDGVVDLADQIALMQHLADYDVSINVINADVNEDGVIDIVDAMDLQEMITTE
jgi:hypothetical protein